MQQTHVKLNTTATQTVITFTATENRRECFTAGGWNILDNDTPGTPEPDPISSAQSRRAWRDSAPTTGTQAQLY